MQVSKQFFDPKADPISFKAKIYFEQIIESLNDKDQVSTETFEQKLNEILKKEETRKYKLVNEMEKLADAKKAQYDIWKLFEAMKVKLSEKVSSFL